MLKAFERAVLVTLILILFGALLWYQPVITIILIVVCWLAFMFFVDPPEDWD